MAGGQPGRLRLPGQDPCPLRSSAVLRPSRDPIRYMLAGPALPEAFMRLAPKLPDDRRFSWLVDLRLITNEPQ